LRRKAQQAEDDDDDAEGFTDARAADVDVDVEALAETYERFGQYDMSGDIITAVSAEVRIPFLFFQATTPPAC
jgi:hypothetical protein